MKAFLALCALASVATAALALVLDGLVLALGRLCLPWNWKRAEAGAAVSQNQEGTA